jgi:hypothetical protein
VVALVQREILDKLPKPELPDLLAEQVQPVQLVVWELSTRLDTLDRLDLPVIMVYVEILAKREIPEEMVERVQLAQLG